MREAAGWAVAIATFLSFADAGARTEAPQLDLLLDAIAGVLTWATV